MGSPLSGLLPWWWKHAFTKAVRRVVQAVTLWPSWYEVGILSSAEIPATGSSVGFCSDRLQFAPGCLPAPFSSLLKNDVNTSDIILILFLLQKPVISGWLFLLFASKYPDGCGIWPREWLQEIELPGHVWPLGLLCGLVGADGSEECSSSRDGM